MFLNFRNLFVNFFASKMTLWILKNLEVTIGTNLSRKNCYAVLCYNSRFSLFAFLVNRLIITFQFMARSPVETIRLIVEAISYITMELHRYCCSVRLCHFSNYFTKNSSSVFLKLANLDKEVI